MLIYAHYYYPDVASTGQLLTELAESLADKLEITVICVVPSYIGKVPGKYSDKAYYYESRNGVKIIRVRVPSYTKKQVTSRLINITTYFRRAIFATFRSGKQDYIFAISQPPVFGGILGVIGKFVKHAKFIYNIQDFNPEQVNAVEFTRSRAMISTMMLADKISCRIADKIVLVGRDMVDTLRARFPKDLPPYCIINNWIDEEEITPLPADDPGVVEFRENHGLTGKFVFMYSGNIGLYYDLEKIMRVLLRFRGRNDIVFAFAGGGAILDRLVEFRNTHHMDNVLFIPYQEKRRLIYSLNAADIHWVVNAKGIKGVSVPSKLYGIMAAGKPVIGLLEEGTEARMIIEDSKCGFVDDPGEEDSIERLIRKVLDNRDTLASMGMSGREYLVKNLSKQKSIERYFEEITN
ncbi:MAG: glycosyltransferase family 4 protein [Lachnospiraceae bacterium]|nr:glycosyltransferase family 4 protein [Lachnospiraceae bacterium]